MIKIAARFKPFSHTPGASCVIPGTCALLEAFPTLLRIGKYEVKLPLTGPVKGFTLEQDLEKNCVRVFGRAQEGYFKLCIQASDEGFHVDVEKGPLKSQTIRTEIPFGVKLDVERLSLGSHKALDWDQVLRRSDLKELLPVLFFLGQKIPPVPPQPLSGTARLLELPTDRSQLAPALVAFFQAAFTKLLVPRLQDDQHQGIVPDETPKGSPFFLIQEGAKMIRGLFFKQNERRVAFLPNLPIPLDAGRLIGIQALGIGQIDFEWSKKLLRRVIIRASTSGEVVLELQKEIKSFRVNKKQRQKGSDPLLLEAGKVYLLDNFQK